MTILTIKDLKRIVAEEEAKWDDKDIEVLGAFDDQVLHIQDKQGYYHCCDRVWYDPCFGFNFRIVDRDEMKKVMSSL